MDRQRLDCWCERGIMGLVLAILIFAPLATGAVRSQDWLIVQGLMLVVLLLWVARFWLNPSHRLLWPPIAWAVSLFVVYAIVRYRQADVEYIARDELIKILAYGFLFCVVLNNLHRQELIQALAYVLIFLGMAISLYAIYQFITHSNKVWHFPKPEGYVGRGSGTYICPNHLAGLLEMIVPLGLAYTLTSRLGHATKVILGYASLVNLAGIAVTISRGAWLATMLGLLLFFGILFRRRQYRMPVLVVLVVLAASAIAFVIKTEQSQKRLQNAFTPGTLDDTSTRLYLWKPTVAMWLDHFWLGVGPAHYDERFRAYRPPALQARPWRAHNDYLNTLADWGVVGAAIVASAWTLLFLGVAKTWKFVQRSANDLIAKNSNRAAFVLGASVGLCTLLWHSLVDFNFHIPANAIVAVTLMAAISSHWRFATERFWFTPGCPTRIGVTLIGLAGIFYLGQQGWRRAQECFWLQRAARAHVSFEEKVEALKKASQMEPNNSVTTYAIGEALRLASWQGQQGYEPLAREALKWFERGMQLNPFDPYNFLRYGMCLDWLGQHQQAAPYFQRALALDPNNHYLAVIEGWHYMQTEDYAAAKRAFERSLQLKWWANQDATAYLEIAKRKLAEASKNR